MVDRQTNILVFVCSLFFLQKVGVKTLTFLYYVRYDKIKANLNKKGVCTLAKQEFLNFKEISEKISFEDVLNWLNIPYKKSDKELKGDDFIVSIEKNLFFCPKNENLKGSIINFTSHHEGIDLRESASKLKAQFLSKQDEVTPKRDIPNLSLNYHGFLKARGISPEIAEEYEVGFVKQRSVMSGRIAFKVYDHVGETLGYVGYNFEKDNWFFPKGFKRPLYNSYRLTDKKFVIVTTDPFDALRIISLGYKNVACLLAKTMTSEQELELKGYCTILLLHPQPENIINRLKDSCYVKAIALSRPVVDISEKEISEYCKPFCI